MCKVAIAYSIVTYSICLFSLYININSLCHDIRQGKVVVIRGEGPKGGPGMPEMLTPTSAIMGAGLGKVFFKFLLDFLWLSFLTAKILLPLVQLVVAYDL